MERIVRCLSPVHIGTGKKLEPFDYIADGQRYLRVNLDAALERLTPEQADELAEWASEQADRIVEAESKDARNEIWQEMQLVKFPDADPAWKQALRNDPALSRYQALRGGFDRNLQVNEQVKDAAETPLIPGSSLKGALRTALAFLALKEMEQDEREKLRRELEREVDKKERIGQQIEQAVFRCGKNDIQYDLMRAVSVSDSDTYNAQAELIVPQIYTFVEQRSKNGRAKLKSQAPLIAEAHAPGNTFRLRLRIDSGLLRAMSRNKWIDFERVKRVFGSEVARLLPDGSDEQIEQAVIARIESANRRFAEAIVKAEQDWVDAHGHNAAHTIRDFYRQLDSLLGNGQVLLRLGWGSHFMATTLLLALREDEGWRPVIEKCFRAFGIGEPKKKGRELDIDDFPRSRRLVSVDRRPAAPFGWIAWASAVADLPRPLVAKEQIIARIQEGGDWKANDRVDAELLEEKTKKGGWKAKHLESGLQGPIQDSQNAPAAKPGQHVQLTIAYVTEEEMAFRWAEP